MTNLHEEYKVRAEKEPEDVEIAGLLSVRFLELRNLRGERSGAGVRHGRVVSLKVTCPFFNLLARVERYPACTRESG